MKHLEQIRVHGARMNISVFFEMQKTRPRASGKIEHRALSQSCVSHADVQSARSTCVARRTCAAILP